MQAKRNKREKKMLKRIAIAILIIFCSATAAMAEYFEIGDYRYTIQPSDPTTVSVMFYNITLLKTITEVTIPQNVTNNNTSYTVTVIEGGAFAGCSKLSSISLPSTITTISSNAFGDCPKLKTITIPASVVIFNAYAFRGTDNSNINTIIFEGITAPTMSKKLQNVYTNLLEIHVLSTAAKNNFISNEYWRASVASDDAIIIDPIAISEAADNSTTLSHHASHTADVELNRTINAAGYNTLCLPFALNAAQIEAAFGTDCDIQDLTSASVSSSGIDMQFTKRTAMEAGKPYLIRPVATVTNPTFQNVILTNQVSPAATADIDFIGIFSPTAMTASENTLILGAGNTLHPTATETMNGLRGYFVLKTSGAKTAAKKQIKMSFGTTTDIVDSQLSTANSQKRIINGQLLIIRDGVYYNAQGIRMN